MNDHVPAHLQNITLLITATLLLTPLASVERDQLPLGHADFYPSPERPVGWRGDGNGAFPGASLVDRFGDGRFQTGAVNKKERIWADAGGSINIAWKYALPGWTMSQPIIIGDRVIQTCEPRTILCLDLHTGKEIWRQELCPFRMLGLKGQERDAALYWESAAWTLTAQRYNMMGNYSVLYGKAKDGWSAWKAHAQRIIKLLDTIEPHCPDMVATAREGLAPGLAILAGTPSDEHKKALAKTFCAPSDTLRGLFTKRFGFQATCHWYSYVGWTWPTPVCDGTWLYVYMNQGQIAKLDLQDGSIAWLRRLSKGAALNLKQPLPRSPLLHQGILYMLANDGLYALDAETGTEVWRWGREGKGDQFSDCTAAVGLSMLQLDSGRSVLVHGKGGMVNYNWMHVFDAKTGEELYNSGRMQGTRNEPGPSLMSDGNIVVFGNAGRVYRLLEQSNKVEVETLWTFTKNQNNVMVLHDGLYYSNPGLRKKKLFMYDVATGKTVASRNSFTLSHYRPGILVGDRLLGGFIPHMDRPGQKKASKHHGAYRWPHQFTIMAKDGRGPISNHVLEISSADERDPLPIPTPQAAPFLNKGLTSRHIAGICCGIPPTFGWGGMYAQGDKLLIPSTKYLYCIAPALKGLATDDPSVAHSIDQTTDAASLKKHLESSSAFYRLRAVKRLADIDATAVNDALQKIVLSEPYDLIRNQALMVLGETGYALIRQQISKRFTQWNLDKRYAASLATLGDQLDPIILPMLAKQANKETRYAAMSAMTCIGIGGPKLRDVLLTMAREERESGLRERATTALGLWKTDQKVTEFMTEVINNGRYKNSQRMAFSYLRRDQAANEQLALLTKVAFHNPDGRLQAEAADQLLRMNPRPPGLFPLFSKAAKAGSQTHMERLGQASAGDKEALAAVLKEILHGGKNLSVSARICMQLDIHATAAFEALTKQLANTKDARKRNDIVNAITQAVRSSPNDEIHRKTILLLTELLAEKDIRQRALESLKGFGAKAAPALDTIKAIKAGDDWKLQNKINDTVKHITREVERRGKK